MQIEIEALRDRLWNGSNLTDSMTVGEVIAELNDILALIPTATKGESK